jgi:hypothetical protein
VVLHGVDRSGAEYACIEGWGIFDGPSDLASVQAIASWHTNAVRVPLNEDCWLNINGVNSAYAGSNYQNAIVKYVNLLNSQGLYAILDLHWSAPGTTPATGQAIMPDADHSLTFWQQVATTFKDDPAALFDVFNEPHPADWSCWKNGGTCSGISYQTAGSQQLVDAVRSTGAKNVILVAGIGWAGDMTQWLAYEPGDPAGQLTASFHVYNFGGCSDTSCWNSVIAPIASHAPIITGELGETDSSGLFITLYMDWADTQGISYLAWTWDTWGCGTGNVVIAAYGGTACAPFGTAYQSHLAAL